MLTFLSLVEPLFCFFNRFRILYHNNSRNNSNTNNNNDDENISTARTLHIPTSSKWRKHFQLVMFYFIFMCILNSLLFKIYRHVTVLSHYNKHIAVGVIFLSALYATKKMMKHLLCSFNRLKFALSTH